MFLNLLGNIFASWKANLILFLGSRLCFRNRATLIGNIRVIFLNNNKLSEVSIVSIWHSKRPDIPLLHNASEYTCIRLYQTFLEQGQLNANSKIVYAMQVDGN